MRTFCDYYNKDLCHSCQSIEVDYPKQLFHKEKEVRSAFPGLKSLEPTVLSSLNGFRHKAKLVVTGTVQKPIIGLAGRDELDLGRELLDCPLHHPLINQLIHKLPEFITACNLRPYQMKERTGELKGIIIFVNYSGTQMYLKLILRSKESLDRVKKHQTRLLLIHPELKIVSANIQPIPHAILEGEEEIILTTDSVIWHNFQETKMLVGTKGFIQTNPLVAERLYSTAATWMKEVHAKNMLELFCGYGAFSFFARPHLKSTTGVEINSPSIEVANLTKEKLNLTQMKFVATSADNVESIIKNDDPDMILVNPPRRGLVGAIQLLKNSNAKGIVYSSCSLETLKKDVEDLSSHFKITKAQVFDMFPHTKHFEILTYLERL